MGALTGLVQKGGRGATAIKAKSPAFCTFRECMEAKLGQIFCARMGTGYSFIKYIIAEM